MSRSVAASASFTNIENDEVSLSFDEEDSFEVTLRCGDTGQIDHVFRMSYRDLDEIRTHAEWARRVKQQSEAA